MLDCSVNAFPKADVVWQKMDGQLPDGRAKQETSGTLVIHQASAEDSGTYLCSAVNELGGDQLNFTVTVFGMMGDVKLNYLPASPYITNCRFFICFMQFENTKLILQRLRTPYKVH